MRLIDADFEIAHWESALIDPTPDVTEKDRRTAPHIIDALKMAGTVKDAVEVVRCKDCKYYHKYVDAPNGGCAHYSYSHIPMYPEDYCSHGERKDDG